MSVTNPRGHLSSETIDLLLLAALSPSDTNEAKGHLDGCELCKQRWIDLNEDSQKFKQYVFARTLPQVEQRLQSPVQSFFERFKLQFVLPAVGLAAAAGLAFVLSAGPGTQTEDDIYVGLKGLESTFEVFAQRAQGNVFAVKANAELKPKDRIRFVVNPGHAKYVMVVSVDGKGAFSVYHPVGGAESEKVESKKRAELTSTIELDDTVGTEKLLVVLSEAPIKADVVKAAVTANAAAPKIDGAKVLTQEFVKVAP